MQNEWKPFAGPDGLLRRSANMLESSADDPYLLWAHATQFADFDGGPDDWIPIIIELQAGTAQDFARQTRPDMRVSPLYRYPAAGLHGTRFCTAFVKREFFRSVQRAPLKEQIRRYEICLPIATRRELTKRAEPRLVRVDPFTPEASGRRPPVIVGIIDDGIAFAHQRFRDKAGRTRVEYFWNQDLARDSERLDYGDELTSKDIDGLIEGAGAAALDNGSARHKRMVDEDAVYNLVGYKAVRQRIAHGTHVMDIACGCDPEDLPESPPGIICVSVPETTTSDTSGRALAAHALDGLRYILKRADSLAGKGAPIPVVVNLSYGNIAGPHDGSSILECAMDEIITERNKLAADARELLEVVLPAGNNYLARCHASFDVPGQETRELVWRIQPDDRTPSFTEIWLPPASEHAGVKVRVTPPDGPASPEIGRGEARSLNRDGKPLCTVIYRKHSDESARDMILICVAPTASFRGERPVAPPGRWRIAVANSNARSLDVNAWIQRDDGAIGLPPRGRQSRFEDSSYERLDEVTGREIEVDGSSAVKREGTLNAIATGEKTIVVGACVRSDGSAARYSSAAGSMAPAKRVSVRSGPDVVAAGEDSVVLGGVLAAGTRSRSVVAMNGTSVAAPQITRLTAEQMASQASTPVAGGPPPPSQRRTKPGQAKRPGTGTGPAGAPSPQPVNAPGAGRARWVERARAEEQRLRGK